MTFNKMRTIIKKTYPYDYLRRMCTVWNNTPEHLTNILENNIKHLTHRDVAFISSIYHSYAMIRKDI